MYSLIVDKLQVTKNGSAILRSASIDFDSGSVTAILGPTGCGKSTLIRAIAGLDYIDTGSIAIAKGERRTDITYWPPAKRAEYVTTVLQRPGVFPGRSPRENIKMVLKRRGFFDMQAKRKAGAILELLDLEEIADEAIGDQFSGGEQARIALGRCLALDPAFLLSDEALSAIDAPLRRRILDKIVSQYRREDKALVFVTHDQIDAFMYADVVGLMERGVFTAVGPVKDVYLQPPSRSAGEFLGLAKAFRGSVLREKAEADLSLLSIDELNGVNVLSRLTAPDVVSRSSDLFVLIRPEDVVVRRKALGREKQEFEAIIRSEIFGGSVILLDLETEAGVRFMSSCPRSSNSSCFQVGTRVAVEIQSGVAAVWK